MREEPRPSSRLALPVASRARPAGIAAVSAAIAVNDTIAGWRPTAVSAQPAETGRGSELAGRGGMLVVAEDPAGDA